MDLVQLNNLKDLIDPINEYILAERKARGISVQSKLIPLLTVEALHINILKKVTLKVYLALGKNQVCLINRAETIRIGTEQKTCKEFLSMLGKTRMEILRIFRSPALELIITEQYDKLKSISNSH